MNTEQKTPPSPLERGGERLNLKHSLFISEMLRHGDKEQAYKFVYPKAEGKALLSAANRLLGLPEVANAITEATNRIRAEAEQELRKRIDKDLFSQLEMKQNLTQIARGNYETEKTYRKHGGYEVVPVKPSISNVLRAMDMFARLEGWYVRQKPATKKETKPEQGTYDTPPEHTWPNNRKMYGPLKYDFYEEDIDYKWQYWDPDDSNTVEQFAAYLASRARRMGIESIPEREIHKLPKDWKTCHKINAGKWDKNYYELMELPKEQSQELTAATKLEQIRMSCNMSSTANSQEVSLSAKSAVRNDGTGLAVYQPPTYKHGHVTPPSPLTTPSPFMERGQGVRSPWVSLAKLINDGFDKYMHNNQQMKYWHEYLKIARLYYAKNFSPEKRAEVQKEAGWELNPDDYMQVRRCA